MKKDNMMSINDRCLAVADEYRRWNEIEEKRRPREVETKECCLCVAYNDEVDVCSIEERELTEIECLSDRTPDWCPLRLENGGPVIIRLAEGV
jgi:hypothetical protein